jgi:hypothetical protein
MKKQIVLHSFDALSFDLLPILVAGPKNSTPDDFTPGSLATHLPLQLAGELKAGSGHRPVTSVNSNSRSGSGQPTHEFQTHSPLVKKGVKHMKALIIAVLTASIMSLGNQVRADGDTATSSSALATNPAYRYPSASDMQGRFGVGVIFGEPTGVSLKYFITDTIAVDGGVGWAFHHHTDLHLHSDILWHDFDLIPVPEGKLPLYFGVGVRLKVEDHADDRFGIRVPVGVSYLFERLPIDIFAEIAPVLDLAPSTRGGLTAGVGVRWWF